jgi:hypothetical protein
MQIFRIKDVLADQDPILLRLEDLLGEELPHLCYAEEVVPCPLYDPSQFFIVEKIIRTKTVNKKKWKLVRFKVSSVPF